MTLVWIGVASFCWGAVVGLMEWRWWLSFAVPLGVLLLTVV